MITGGFIIEVNSTLRTLKLFLRRHRNLLSAEAGFVERWSHDGQIARCVGDAQDSITDILHLGFLEVSGE